VPSAVAAPPLVQFPGTLGCISEDGSGGRCAAGVGLAGVESVATAPGVTPGSTRVYAVSPSQSTLAVLEADPLNGGFRQLQCFSALPRAGCTVARALRGAIDVVVSARPAVYGSTVYVAARDDDAVAVFRRTADGLRQPSGTDGCVALALAGCALVPALDEPVAIDVDWRDVQVVSRRSESVVLLSEWDAPDGPGRLAPEGCMQSGPDATADGCKEIRGLVDPVDISSTTGEGFVAVRDGIVASQAAWHYGNDAPHCANATGDGGCTRIPSLRGARYVAAVMRSGVMNWEANVYVSEPGAANLQHLVWGLNAGFQAEAGVPVAAAGPLALITPVEDGLSMYYGGSHLYMGGDDLQSFRRPDGYAGALEPAGVAARFPPGPIEGVAASPEPGASAALYATVPSAGAILALRRNRPPACGYQEDGAQMIRQPSATLVAVPCRDLDGDPLSYSVERPPSLGRITGFSGGAALYDAPDFNHSFRGDTFTIRVSDGSDSEVVQLGVDLDYVATGPIKVRVVDKRLRMDKRGRVRLRVRCVSEISTCDARLAAYRGHRVAGGKAKLRSGHAQRVRLRLPKAIRRSVRRHRNGVRLRFVATAADAGGGTGRASRRVLVHPARRAAR
jgi:hypothetical protein